MLLRHTVEGLSAEAPEGTVPRLVHVCDYHDRVLVGEYALCLNLALALKADSRMESVDFATVWGQGHTMAERTGSAEQNFIAWVESCLA